MIRQFFDRIRLFLARYKIERPPLEFPKFRSTLLILWALSFLGLAYGHIFSATASQAQTLSLLLTLIGWIGATFIVLLRNPFIRLRILLIQVMVLSVLLAFVFTLSISYSILYLDRSKVLSSIQYAWFGGTVVLGYTTWRLINYFFHNFNRLEERFYPGFFSAPCLFIVLVLNYAWWVIQK